MTREVGRARAVEHQVASRLSNRLVDELAAAGSRSRFTAGGVLLTLLATAVHAVTVVLLAGGGWLVLTAPTWPLRVLGGVGLLAGCVLLPRFPRGARGPGLMDDEAFPETAGLVREVAALVGSSEPTRMQVSEDFNASAEATGLRGRTLTIGAPLWAVCSPQARVALLGHELGHFAHGDVLQGRYVWSAYHALETWIDILTPGSPHDGAMSLWRPVTWPVRAALAGYLRLMWLANAASARRREHYADLASVVAGGTDGAVDLLETLLAETGVGVVCNRVAISPGRPPLRPALESFAADYDGGARNRSRTRGAAERSRIDDSHPPTVERLRLVESKDRTAPAVLIDDARRRALDVELSEPMDVMLEDLAAGYRGS